jgi:hypothetical protein
MTGRLRALAAALGLLMMWTVTPASAAGAQSPPAASQVVLGSSFHQIKGVGEVVASGDYLLLATAVSSPYEIPSWIVINQRLGTRTTLDSQCLLFGLGPPWALMGCPQTSNPYEARTYELYSLADGTRQTVTPAARLPQQCPQGDGETECASADAVGAHWIRWDASCYHCAITSLFQNIQTGELRADPTNATTFADLNSPALAHTTCPGVRLLRNFDSPGAVWGSLTTDGQFALATGTNNSVYLERCGTRMLRLLGNDSRPANPLASNDGAIVWQTLSRQNGLLLTSTQLNGLLLPSLQRFTIPLPSPIAKQPGLPSDPSAVAGLELTPDALYVRDESDGAIWQTASPTALPLNTSRPELTRSDNTITCRRGRWRDAVTFSYTWRVNSTAKKAAKPTLAIGETRKRRSVSCSVTASNAAGTTTASSAQLHVR